MYTDCFGLVIKILNHSFSIFCSITRASGLLFILLFTPLFTPPYTPLCDFNFIYDD